MRLGITAGLLLLAQVAAAQQTPPVSVEDGWTITTLRLHLDAVLAERSAKFDRELQAIKDSIDLSQRNAEKSIAVVKEATVLAQQNAERAVLKAETATEKRLESVNEFRNTLSDQQKNLMPRSEANIQFKSLEDQIKILQELAIRRSGQTEGTSQVWTVLAGALGAAGTCFGIAAFFYRTESKKAA